MAAALYAQDIPGMTHRVLDNGLELFMLENHNVPLTTVQITFRCGALTQTPETAGLFHLYEHMLFKGNRTYKTQTDFMAAMKSLGVGNWNGGTSTEYVTYYFTIPSDKTEEGISFWSEAVRFPLFNESELAVEKGVVTNEIKGYHNDPSDNFSQAVSERLFYKYPWRRDVSGPVDVIQNCTIDQLREMQKTFYTPDNCALFVAGDINPEEVGTWVSKLMGDWERNPDPYVIQNAHPLMAGNSRAVFQEPSMYPDSPRFRCTCGDRTFWPIRMRLMRRMCCSPCSTTRTAASATVFTPKCPVFTRRSISGRCTIPRRTGGRSTSAPML